MKKSLPAMVCFALSMSSCVFSANGVSFVPGDGLEAEGKGDWNKALVIYEQVLKKDPDRIDLWLRIASIEKHLKNYPLVFDAYRHAIAIKPMDPLLYEALSQNYAEAKQPEEALAAMNEALKLSPNNINYLKAQAKLAVWVGNTSIALSDYEKIIKMNPDDKEAIESLASLKKSLAPTPLPNSLFPPKAIEAETHAQWEVALGLYQAEVEKNPKQAPLWIKVAEIEHTLHHLQKTIHALKMAIAIEPKNPVLYKGLSEVYAENNQPNEALSAITEAVKCSPKNQDYLKANAILANWAKDPKTAKAMYLRLLELNPNNKDASIALKNLEKTLVIQKNPAVALSPYDALIASVNNLSSLHRYDEAAQTLKRGMHQFPSNAALYIKLSEIYSVEKKPQPALEAINQAVKLEPNNLTTLFLRAQVANWAKNNGLAIETYVTILKLQPNNAKAMLQLARVLSWDKQLNASKTAYYNYLTLYPQTTPDAWIEYANVSSWTSDYIASFSALKQYAQRFGQTELYLRTNARILASAGRYQSALNANEPLLKAKPTDPYLLTTKIVALNTAHQKENAVNYLQQLNEFLPNAAETLELNDVILTPLRSNMNGGASYDSASNTVRIIDVPLNLQYFVSPTTSLIAETHFEDLSASVSSGLQTVTGQTQINNTRGLFGFKTEFSKLLEIKVLAGALNIQRGPNLGIYDAVLDTNLNEALSLSYKNSHNLFRPYLTATSPKMVSLAVMESKNAISLQFEPFIEKYLSLYTNFSNLSDTNAYWHTIVAPKARIYSGQHLLATLGVLGDWWEFKKRLNNGYYSPRHFQEYAGTYEFFMSQTPKVSYWLFGATGIQKDETFRRYFLAQDLGAAAEYEFLPDWLIKANAGLTLRGGPISTYSEWIVGARLTRVF